MHDLALSLDACQFLCALDEFIVKSNIDSHSFLVSVCPKYITWADYTSTQ